MAVCPPASTVTARSSATSSPAPRPLTVTVGGRAATVKGTLTVVIWPRSLVTVTCSVAGPGGRSAARRVRVPLSSPAGCPLTANAMLVCGDWLVSTSTLTVAVSSSVWPAVRPLMATAGGMSATVNSRTISACTPPWFSAVMVSVCGPGAMLDGSMP